MQHIPVDFFQTLYPPRCKSRCQIISGAIICSADCGLGLNDRVKRNDRNMEVEPGKPSGTCDNSYAQGLAETAGLHQHGRWAGSRIPQEC